MSKTNALHVNGIVPIVPTPFTIEELIDWPSLQRVVDFARATGACAMCLPARASEVAEAVRQAACRHLVLAQVNFVSVPQAVETALVLAISDGLAKVFPLAIHNDLVGAYQIHEGALPQISFSMQHVELFHHTEKRLLVTRGILPSAATLQVDRHTEDRIAFLNGRILALLDQLDLPHHPGLLPSQEGVLQS
jgi:hypothetical protein